MEFDRSETHILIRLKDTLRLGGHLEQEKDIDYILCQYASKNILTKKQYLHKLIMLCHIKAYGDLYIPNMEYHQWLSFLTEIQDLFQNHLSELERQITNMPISELSYNSKKYIVLSDAFCWIQNDDVLVFLLKDNDQYFQDNIVAVNFKGEYLWSTKDTINIKNRNGAVFIYLRKRTDKTVSATAWVGINYELDIKTGTIINSTITK